MSDKKVHTLSFEMTDSEATAFAQFLKRVTLEDFQRFAPPYNQNEPFLMQNAAETLRKSFAEIGYSPR